MPYVLPACRATGSPRVEYEVSHPQPGVAIVQRRSGRGPWEIVSPSDLRMALAAPTELASWLRDAMGTRPAHRPRLDPSAARVSRGFRCRPETFAKIDAEAKRSGESAGQVIDRLAQTLN